MPPVLAKDVKAGESFGEAERNAYLCVSLVEFQQRHRGMKKTIATILPFALLVVLGIVIVLTQGDYLFRVQELGLFLTTGSFFWQSVGVAGGFLSWVSALLTAQLFHPWVGALVLLALWCGVAEGARRAFAVPRPWAVAALLPVAFLAIGCFHLGYWIYYLKLQGFFFAGSVGTLVSIWLVWAYRRLPDGGHLRSLMLLASVAVGYPLFGFYALFAVLCMGVMAWKVRPLGRRKAIVDTLLALVGMAVVPLVCYEWVFNATSLERIYLAGLPLFNISGTTYWPYYSSYFYLFGTLLAFALLYGRWPSVEQWKPWRRYGVAGSLLVLCVGYVAANWYRDANFYSELRMHRALQLGDNDGVLAEAEKVQNPTRLIWFLKNIALMRKGTQGDDMYRYRNGSARSVAPFEVNMIRTDGKLVYLAYGQTNYCLRWCMEDGVELGWKQEHLALMLKCALMNGEWNAARKYVGLLRHTLYYKDMANHYATYIGKPGVMARDKELAFARHLMVGRDRLTNDNMILPVFLLNHFARISSSDPILQEQSLLFAMQGRDSGLCWPKYWQYLKLHPGKRVPTLYQQAAWLFAQQEGVPEGRNVDVSPEVKSLFQRFMRDAAACRGLSLDEVRQTLYADYGDTYFYEYLLNGPQRAG